MSLQEQVRLAIETLEAEVKQLDELIGGLEAAKEGIEDRLKAFEEKMLEEAIEEFYMGKFEPYHVDCEVFEQ